VILNSTHTTKDTPPAILDWLDLIKESMKNPENPKINTAKPAIVRAALLGQTDNIDPEEVADAKIEEMRKETLARVEIDAKRDVKAAQDEAERKVQEAQDEAKKEVQEAQVKAKAAQKEVQKENIVNLLKMGKLSIEDIANVFGVTSAYVKQIEKAIH
jgi:DNA-directed RNA polymerase specialized sigma subunit